MDGHGHVVQNLLENIENNIFWVWVGGGGGGEGVMLLN